MSAFSETIGYGHIMMNITAAQSTQNAVDVVSNLKAEAAKAEEEVKKVAALISSWFVRMDGKFFEIDNLGVRLSKDDVERACLARLEEIYGYTLNEDVLNGALKLAIVTKISNPKFTIRVWNGLTVCDAGNSERLVHQNGMVTANTWSMPTYREHKVPAEFGIVTPFLERIFPVENERRKIIDWVAWNLQNEGQKPNWAPLLYSEEKGSGKSTFCQLLAALFGIENSVTQNNVKRLATRFNSTVLQSKLVISEELQLRTDGVEANVLKTYLTEDDALAERKGQEAVRIKQSCVFVFTTNHLPTWIEAGDRRFYVLEINHDGHASGPQSEEFGALVADLKAALKDPKTVAAIYRAFMEHRVSEGFSAKHFNPEREATDVMRRLRGTGQRVIAESLKERMKDKGIRAIRQQTLMSYAARELRASPEVLRHLLPQMKLHKQEVKWGGVDHARVIWVTEGSRVERGRVYFENGEEEALEKHLEIDFTSQFDQVSANG